MKHTLALFFLTIILFSCGSKKKVITKKSQEEKTQTISRTQKQPENQPTRTPSKNYKNATLRYIDTYKDIAKQEMNLYKIPASITLAQGILESASGNGRLSTKANNHFGIKCHDWKGAKIYHDDDRKGECFRKYKDAKYSFRDHSLFLSEKKRYSKLFALRANDYKGWARGLKAAGYATDSKYPQKLISLIERYNLTQYDNPKTKRSKPATSQVVNNTPPKNNNGIIKTRVVPTRVTHIVVKGDTLYYIAKLHNLSVEELKFINDLKDNNIKIGQELQVSKK